MVAQAAHNDRLKLPGPSVHPVRNAVKMSWVRSALSQASEDVFDEEADEMDVAQKEWRSAMEKRVKVMIGVKVNVCMGADQGWS